MNAETDTDSHAAQVVCPAAKDLIVRPVILAVALIAFGIWCALDQKEHVPFDKDMNGWLSWAMNFYGQFAFTALGLIPLAFALRAHRRILVADEVGFGYAGKESIAWSDVTGLDASELEAKQILQVLHGRDKRFVLDGFNLRNFAELVAFVEDHVPHSAAPPAADEPGPTIEPGPAIEPVSPAPPGETDPEQTADEPEPGES